MNKKPYISPSIERWDLNDRKMLNLLVSLSIAGDVADWEAGDPNDLYEDDWE